MHLMLSQLMPDIVFYCIRIPQHVAEYFALPPLGASLLDSCKGKYEGLDWPCVAALPMGFPWALWFAQEITRSQFLSAGMPADSELNAHSMDCRFEMYKERFVVYVNNIAVFGLHAHTVDEIMANIKESLKQWTSYTRARASLYGLRAVGFEGRWQAEGTSS